jgi:general secretion pathway protein B
VSYILDALRRADAERERGSVPSLHAQSTPPTSSDSPPLVVGKPMLWAVAGLSLALLASIAWQFLGREPASGAADANVAAQAPQVSPAMQQTTTTLPAAPAPAPSAPVQTDRISLPPVPAAAPAPLPAVKHAPAPTTVAAAPAASAGTRIPTQDELPADIRAQVPKLVVGGSIYSESAASRFLILNGQIVHENEKVMPELVLEQIKLKSAVLRYRNQRFTISY